MIHVQVMSNNNHIDILSETNNVTLRTFFIYIVIIASTSFQVLNTLRGPPKSQKFVLVYFGIYICMQVPKIVLGLIFSMLICEITET